ncbi:unnamed protein product [Schistocephalus solidus]|uniref:Poly-beta-1,6-N-acetyl-D-glucosamine biosynthesis protein PgaD n=1 Tax=Schistocephalus solidus TaxID=70667 RepID=A0A183S8Q6_SCHSO|nr:unnamed protein product [Schistocephalus solidus]
MAVHGRHVALPSSGFEAVGVPDLASPCIEGSLSTLDSRVVKPHKAPRQALRHNIRRSGRYVPKPDLLPRYASPYDLQFQQPVSFSGQSASSHAPYIFPVASKAQSHGSHMSTMLSISDGRPTYIGKDFVPHHQLWPNWILSLLCFVQYVSCWVCIGYHAVNYNEDSGLEVGLSLGFLLGGNVVLTGIVNTALFWYRWSMASPRTRAKAAEQNHEAWICTRVALTLIGLAPIARIRNRGDKFPDNVLLRPVEYVTEQSDTDLLLHNQQGDSDYLWSSDFQTDL